MKFAYLLVLAMGLASHANAQAPQTSALAPAADQDFDTAAMSDEQLLQMDKQYEQETGLASHMPAGRDNGCERATCHIFALVDKSKQTLELYQDGVLQYTWPVSTARRGYSTPDYDRHPDGRIYDHWMSHKFPGGDYKGLGNMPYAVFIKGGVAIHGVPQGEWRELGRAASHGCVRIHPDNAFIFNRLVRAAGIENTWVTIQE